MLREYRFPFVCHFVPPCYQRFCFEHDETLRISAQKFLHLALTNASAVNVKTFKIRGGHHRFDVRYPGAGGIEHLQPSEIPDDGNIFYASLADIEIPEVAMTPQGRKVAYGCLCGNDRFKVSHSIERLERLYGDVTSEVYGIQVRNPGQLLFGRIPPHTGRGAQHIAPFGSEGSPPRLKVFGVEYHEHTRARRHKVVSNRAGDARMIAIHPLKVLQVLQRSQVGNSGMVQRYNFQVFKFGQSAYVLEVGAVKAEDFELVQAREWC